MTEEVWKPVVGYETWYEISDQGRIRRIAPSRCARSSNILRPSNANGYLGVTISCGRFRTRRTIHRMVVEAFLGLIPSTMQVNHKNGVKTDNRMCNLEIVTGSENQRHSIRLGLRIGQRGEKNVNAKLTDEIVREIRRLYAEEKATQAQLARRFGVRPRNVCRIIHRERWAYVADCADDGQLNLPKRPVAVTVYEDNVGAKRWYRKRCRIE